MINQKHNRHLQIVIAFILVSFTGFQASYAQLVDTNRIITEDGWIEKMNRNFGLKLSFDNEYETFKVMTESNDIVLYPNVSTNINFAFTYRFFRLSLGIAPRFLPGNGDEAIKGSTSTIALATSLVTRHWIQNLSYNWVRGYYLRNTADYDPNWKKGDPYIQIPDLVYQGFSGATAYIFNPKLSIRSISIQTERQLKSAGSFLIFLNYRYYIIDNQAEIQQGLSTQKSNNLDINIGPGYYYTFVHREKFYATLGFRPSIGLMYTKLTTRFTTGEVVSYQDNFTFRWHAVGALGYNGRTFFTGLYVNISGMRYKQENTTAINAETRFFYELFFGMRLKASERSNRFFDKFSF